MVERMAAEVPEHYLDGVAAIEVSPKVLPDPVHADVYTLGECVPIDTGTDEVLSRVVLYHGSFRELSLERPDFDWREEAWETLLHELRHHLEWRARADQLEAYDWAAGQNFRRHEGRGFDPLFYQSGEQVAQDIFRVEDDVFVERVVTRPPSQAEIPWHGVRYRVALPPAPLPLFLALDGVAHPPPGDLVAVFRRKPRLWDLFRRPAPVTEQRARVEPAD
jgi:hypothetical protein